MNKILAMSILVLGLLSLEVNSKIQTANHVFESDMTVEECLQISKTARESLFDEKFGEIVADGMYDYLRDDIHFTVLCMTEKKTIVLFVAAQDKDVYKYISKFSDIIEGNIKQRAIKLNQ